MLHYMYMYIQHSLAFTKVLLILVCTSGVARKFERWGKRSIFPTSGRGHVGVAKHCVVIRF